ncbi:polymorphic toxin-type HINT domain-containing protein [Solwaraspora sp. WMMD792]|uniref:polymorphic toxin-type HINT domain-containing protein n=1 Tax=Solwaraspora sp. WMMD792 TaxID=3016099 RepID=UPI002417E817|nr:polymorphic toxin-type HINT domain-containing protein [Solwaraspora sp. WMMD792]MDG4770307.1 polymorphic toxin-type HINT domain-containing protein [Solwaraspora sp. WMMD792]
MADGSHKPIEDVEIGDRVVASDPETGETAVKAVTATIEGTGDKDLVEITVAVGDGQESQAITATDGHPFWVASQATWRDASTLRPGDELLAPDGSRLRVIDILAYQQPATVHNLTVADIHTYYVLAGNVPVLVHNCTASPDDLRPTHPISGDSSSKKVASMRNQMRDGTFDWEESGPISIARNGDEMYVVDGHHRLDAARRAGLGRVPIQDVTDQLATGGFRGYADMDDVIRSAQSFMGNRLNPYKLR